MEWFEVDILSAFVWRKAIYINFYRSYQARASRTRIGNALAPNPRNKSTLRMCAAQLRR